MGEQKLKNGVVRHCNKRFGGRYRTWVRLAQGGFSIGQFGLEAAPKRLGRRRTRQGIIVAFAVPAHVLRRIVLGD